MTITEQINQDIKQAMLNKEKEKLEALRSVKSALLLEATKDGSQTVDDEKAIPIMQKLVKQRKESIDIYKSQGRQDLAEAEEFQSAIIEKYLPEQMGEEEIKPIIEGIIKETEASGPSDMGKVMGQAMGKLKGKADGGLISKIVKELLNS